MYKLHLMWEDDDGNLEFLDDAELPTETGHHNVETYMLDHLESNGEVGHRLVELFANVESR